MRQWVLLVLCACFVWFTLMPRLHAETFFGPSTMENKLLIGSNEAVIITSVMCPTGGVSGGVVVSNSSYAVRLYATGQARLGLAGPAELRLASACAVYFKRVQSAAIRTVLLAGKDATNGFLVSVPRGKTLEFFDSFNPDFRPNVFLVREGGGSNQVQVLPRQTLEGPVDVRFRNTEPENVASFSYFFVEDVFEKPDGSKRFHRLSFSR